MVKALYRYTERAFSQKPCNFVTVRNMIPNSDPIVTFVIIKSKIRVLVFTTTAILNFLNSHIRFDFLNTLSEVVHLRIIQNLTLFIYSQVVNLLLQDLGWGHCLLLYGLSHLLSCVLSLPNILLRLRSIFLPLVYLLKELTRQGFLNFRYIFGGALLRLLTSDNLDFCELDLLWSLSACFCLWFPNQWGLL